MAFSKVALDYLTKNLRYAKAVARTPAGKSFIRWGMTGAGLGAVYGMADNITGNDRTSVVQGAVRGAMFGMGARGLMKGFKGLGLRGATMGRGASMYGGQKLLPYYPSAPKRISGLLGGPSGIISGNGWTIRPVNPSNPGTGFEMVGSGTFHGARRRVRVLLPDLSGRPNWGGQGGIASTTKGLRKRAYPKILRRPGMYGYDYLRPGD